MMRLTVQQLNADTTFLLTFSGPANRTTSGKDETSAYYTILIDPWLTGPSPIFHAYFAVSRHSTESSIQSLAELSKPPDLVVISQPKNDHCNKETLCTLPRSWKGTIVAVPAAAKKIRSWKYFDEEQVQVIPAYNPKTPTTIVRHSLESTSGSAAAGEITIANVPEPYDLSAVHNAIGITYHPPSSFPSHEPAKPISIVYTPHGLTPSLIEPYITHHLRPSNAYPVDLLFHSLNTEANPKLMGGVVSNGAPGGVPLAKMLGAREWIGAHDEEKDNGGIATKLIRCTSYAVEDVERMLEEAGVQNARMHKLGVGDVFVAGEEGSGDQNRQGIGKLEALANGHG